MESRRFKVRYRRTYVLNNMLNPKTTLKYLNLKIYNCVINILIKINPKIRNINKLALYIFR